MPASPALYVFRRTIPTPVKSAALALEWCAHIGGDLLHYRPSGAPFYFKELTQNYFSRDYPADVQDRLIAQSLKSTTTLCQSKSR